MTRKRTPRAPSRIDAPRPPPVGPWEFRCPRCGGWARSEEEQPLGMICNRCAVSGVRVVTVGTLINEPKERP